MYCVCVCVRACVRVLIIVFIIIIFFVIQNFHVPVNYTFKLNIIALTAYYWQDSIVPLKPISSGGGDSSG